MQMIQLKKGILITVEGVDGSGKSTLVRNVHQSLTKKQYSALATQEPGSTELGKQLRALVQKQPIPIAPKAEYLLFAADRANHFEQIIIPALQEKKIIISDRMADSSIVYQGYGRGLDISMIKKSNTWAMNNIKPDLTFYIKLSAAQAFERLEKRKEELTAFEKRSFIEKIVSGFDILFKDKKQVITLNGLHDEYKLTHDVLTALESWIKQNNLFI